MAVFTRNLRFVKCLFLVLLVASAILLLRMALQFQLTDERAVKEITYEPLPLSDDYTRRMLRPKFQNCIIRPSKVFCIFLPDSEVQLLETDGSLSKTYKIYLNNITKENETNPAIISLKRRHPLHGALDDFTSLCNAYGVKVTLLEPSLLFCMLKLEHQVLLIRRRLNLTSILGSENVLTLAVVDQMNATKLEQPDVIIRLKSAGFQPHSIKTKMKSKNSSGLDEEIATHHFYIRYPIVIHVVVFQKRFDYFWHSKISALPKEVSDIVPVENLLFSQTEAIYERFLPVKISAKPAVNILYLPLDPQLFLHEISTSSFLACNLSHSIHMKNATRSGHPSGMSEKMFSDYTVIALKELKAQLRPILMTFWIFGGTLLGWYRECGIIKYTNDVDFSAWAADIDDDDEELIRIFKKNKYLKLNQLMGLKNEGFELRFYVHDLMVDLFFTYETNENYWVAGHRPSKFYYFPYSYPKFTLCSADLLGYKVQVPCETKETILADYGLDWDKPVSTWFYEESPKNMGPKRYWNESQKAKIHVSF